MRNRLFKPVTVVIFITALINHHVYGQNDIRLFNKVTEKMENWKNPLPQFSNIAKPKLDSVHLLLSSKNITLFFSPGLSYYPFREESSELFIQSVKKSLGRKFRKYKIEVMTNNLSLDQFIPNIFRKETLIDSARIPVPSGARPLHVKRVSLFDPVKGLFGNTVALWHSHGYYYEMNLDRWEWQRARLFGTVEDIAVMEYIVPYLTKMLENSGAIVYLPRERDTQVNEIIVDNDLSTGSSELMIKSGKRVQNIAEGFLLTDTIFPHFNPFEHGTSIRILSDSAVFVPEIPEKGYYAIYVSYPARIDNSNKVLYLVAHTGGKTGYIIDQTIGGKTWVYLGTFQFNKGKNMVNGSVTVKGSNNDTKYIALDAVRFGGGLGNVARRPSSDILENMKSDKEYIAGYKPEKPFDSSEFNWKLSGKPRFLEGARYFLQYAGMPDTIVYSPTSLKNDYIDDYQSRGNWVNYLMGNPYSIDNNNKTKGLGLPVDISFALHTDAGVTPGDSVIGTLAIYSTSADKGKFTDGTSRMASRDLADIIQTEVIDNIRETYNPLWTRRGLWDKPYSEAKKPNIPSVLLELLSHQNLADQRYGLDPRFRFSVCRAIYTGMLKYLAYVENRDYAVQPLPVSNMAITPLGGKKIFLSWEPVLDLSEPSSKPDRYIIYTRIGENGFDNGIVVDRPYSEIELKNFETIYSFKVAALNDGGQSFDSEILSVGLKENNARGVIVVNGFDRISGPAWFDNDGMAGISWWNDRGVAYHSETANVGDQYDFERKSEWLDDDAPGWGASYGDMAGRILPGNSFDFPIIHGKAIIAAGYSFYSVSNKYFCSTSFRDPGPSWKNIDIILGEEKSTKYFNDTSRTDYEIYTHQFMKRVKQLTESGTSIFISGAYVGSDIKVKGDSTAFKFASETLHFMPRTGHAVRSGKVYCTDYAGSFLRGSYDFNTGNTGEIYQVEAPDAIEPSGKGSICSLRYSENNSSAGVMYKGIYKTAIFGFPFETIISEQQRNDLMQQILKFFEK